MASVGRRLTHQINPYISFQSLVFSAPNSRYFRNNVHGELSDESDPPFRPCKPNSAPDQSSDMPKNVPKQSKSNNGKKNKMKKALPAQTLSPLDSKGQNPVHSTLPFDFQYSYSETNPNVLPIGFREPKFSPFGPGRLDRKWTGWSAPAASSAVTAREGNVEKNRKSREEILGKPLTEDEIAVLVEKYGRSNCDRQINLGRGGVTHNMLDDIHNHWKRAEAVRIKCLGVPTIDMDNLCFHLEDKTGGKIISRRTNILILYRGRHYDPKQRPFIPLMLWRPHEPIYPRLINNVANGLTFEETKEMRNRGLNTPALTKLTKNGVYVHLVEKVREAFIQNELVRIDCKGMETSDYKKVGAKLRDLVPCVLLIFKDEQIVIWRGRNYDVTKASSRGLVADPVSGGTINSLMIVNEAQSVPLEFLSNAYLQSNDAESTFFET